MENKNSVFGGTEKTPEGGLNLEQYETPEKTEKGLEAAQEAYGNANLLGQRALENIDEVPMGVVIDNATEEQLNPNMVDGELIGTDLPRNAGDGEKMNEKWADEVEKDERETRDDPGEFLRRISTLRWRYLETQFGREKGDGLGGKA